VKILIVEDSVVYRKIMNRYIKKHLVSVEADFVGSFEELKNVSDEYDLYVLDYILPDSQNGEHVEYLLSKNKKVVVISQFELFKNSGYKEKVIDFIVKNDTHALSYLVTFIKRFYKNQNLRVILADDSSTVRNHIGSVLRGLGIETLNAKNGKEVMKLLEEEKADLIITDLNMPEMDGEEVISEVRKKYSMSELPIIVVSGNEADEKFLKALKSGANDYLKKPFLKEELILRVNNLLEIYEHLRSMQGKLQHDALTGAFNRMFLETTLDNLFAVTESKAVVMLDIDHFKKINDTHGHQNGDKVLKHFVSTVKNSIRKTDYVVRYGGEEFLIFMPNTTKLEAALVTEKIRKSLKPCGSVKYTFSAGIADEGETLAEMIRIADKRLYEAKNSGRNRVVVK